MIYVGGEYDFFAARGDYIAGETFAVQHHVGVEAIFGAEGSGFRENVPGAGICSLNFCERAVLAEDGQSFEEDRVIGTSGPVGEILADEIGAEEIGPVAAGTIALRDAGEIELGVLKKSAFGGEAGLQWIFAIFCEERAEEIGTHAGVKILADLQRDFGFFRERERNVFGDLVLRGVEMSEWEEIWRVRMFRRLD